jgi:oxalate decarboxylase
MAIYQSVSITAWMASTPDLLLATNFKVPESTFTAFPKGKEVMPD